LVAVATFQGFCLIDLLTGAERAFVRTADPCQDTLFEPDGTLLVKTSTQLVRWPVAADPGDPTRLRVGPPELLPVTAKGETVARSADGAVLAASDTGDGAVVWRRDRPHDVVRLVHPDCRHVSLSPNGKLVATGSWHGRGLKVWSADTGELVKTLIPEQGTTVPLFSPDGKWLAGPRGQRWRVGDWSEGPNPPPGVLCSAFSPDGRVVAWGLKGSVVLTDSESGAVLARLEDPHQDGLGALTFSADGALLFGPTQDSACVRVWDLRKLRAGLKALDLDWPGPDYPPAPPADPNPRPLAVTVVDEYRAAPVWLTRGARDRALQAVWLNPLDADARLDLGVALLLLNQPREAEAQLSAALALRPEQTGGYRLRAAARFRSGDWPGCVADVDAYFARFPEGPLLRWYRGYALTRLGRDADALPDLTAFAQHAPTFADVFFERAEAHRRLGHAAEAAADWKRAAEVATPQSTAWVRTLVAWRLVSDPMAERDPKRALELVADATARSPADAFALNTLGIAHYRSGDWREAVAVVRRRVATGRTAANDGHGLFALAVCHMKLGDPDAARDAFRQAVAIQQRPGLMADTVAELRAFRAEAEAALAARPLAPPPRERK
jgi:tetratricopeptide (TPR) repeat protein